MKNFIPVLLSLFSLTLGHSQIVNIPDAAFKTALLNYQPVIDTNHDSEIQVSEALLVTDLNFNNQNFISGNLLNILGIEAFTNLTSLALTPYNNLVNIDLSALANLQNLNCNSSGYLLSLNLTGLVNLQTLDCSNCYDLVSLNLSGFTNLQTLNCSGCYDLISLDLSGLSSLQTLNCSNDIRLTSLNLTGLTNLQTLDCYDCSQLSSLDLTGLSNLTSVKCYRDRQLHSLITTGANNITHLDCSQNGLSSLTVTGMTNLQYLDCGFQQNLLTNPIGNLSTLDLTGLNSITYLNCNSNSLTNLDIAHLTNLTYLNCSYNLLTTLDVTPFVNLTDLQCAANQIPVLNLTPLVHLTNIVCHANLISVIDLSTLTALERLECSQNSISTIDFSSNAALTFLSCSGNLLSTIDVSNLVNLKSLLISGNQLTTLDLSNLHHLTDTRVGGNLFTTLDFSQAFISTSQGLNYQTYNVGNSPNLTYVNVKNGGQMSYSGFTSVGCPNLQYICADENNIQAIQHDLDLFGDNGNVQVNSYCTFVPGGMHNTITGTATLDVDNNGCDAINDIHPHDLRININDGTLTGATFSGSTGNYSFFTQTGSFVLTPQFQNPYFTATPAAVTLNFPNLDESTQTQNFCIVPNGVHNDLDVTIVQSSNARPGFDATFVLVYKNKGNQVLSGNINLTFDDAILDFVSAVPTTDSQSLNNLNWNFSNILPFETRIIYFTLNVNGPMETPPVNIDDILHFTATINPISGDETTEDNVFNSAQTVRGSFDPNDKVCLEGNFIRPENVGDYLHYVIRFQNSGTAPAENIVVKDVLDAAKFDVSTFQLTSSSHPQVTRIAGNKVEFVFENINLPAEIDNEPASHGWVAFKVKTKSNLVLGNNISNTANIYFDYNFPIVTNTTSTTVSNLGVEDHEDISVNVHPNPVKNILSISAKDNITSIQLFDVQGRLIAAKLNSSMEASIDLSQQTTGIYFVKVYTDNGMKVEKIIKQ